MFSIAVTARIVQKALELPANCEPYSGKPGALNAIAGVKDIFPDID